MESQPEQEHVGKNAATKAFIPSIFACRCPGSVGPFLSFIILCKKKLAKNDVFFCFWIGRDTGTSFYARQDVFTFDSFGLISQRADDAAAAAAA